MIAVGSKAPDVKGTLADGSTFTTESARGRPLVLFFYNKDFSGGCTAQVCAMRDASEGLQGARVVGVSRDDPATHARFIQDQKLPFELLSDPDLSVAKAFDALLFGGLVPLPKRVAYVIDSDGIVRGIYRHDIKLTAHAPEVQKCLEAIKAGAPCA